MSGHSGAENVLGEGSVPNCQNTARSSLAAKAGSTPAADAADARPAPAGE
jgi:hypothetical protein